MLDGLTWAALSQQWPWFATAVAIFLIAIGHRRQAKVEAEPTAAADKDDWKRTFEFACRTGAGISLGMTLPHLPLAPRTQAVQTMPCAGIGVEQTYFA